MSPDHLEALLSQGQRLRRERVCGRFAPTPSGPLHLGNLRTALLSWLQVRLQRGQWFLRIDDLDPPRVRPGATDSALDDLRWLGLHWDGDVIFQSQRLGIYNTFLSAMRREGLLYACRCTRQQLAGIYPYPGTCRQRALDWGIEGGRLPSWRLMVPDSFASSCGDPVVRRADGFVAYHLATVVDELTLGITDVVRGDDLVSACSAHQAVAAVLGQPSPVYHHVPLLLTDGGVKLSKRDKASGIAPLRALGWEPEQMVGHLAASLNLVPSGTCVSAADLLESLRMRPRVFWGLLQQVASS
jgi:glutamyl/glutaminyl-tRNA synthetase